MKITIYREITNRNHGTGRNAVLVETPEDISCLIKELNRTLQGGHSATKLPLLSHFAQYCTEAGFLAKADNYCPKLQNVPWERLEASKPHVGRAPANSGIDDYKHERDEHIEQAIETAYRVCPDLSEYVFLADRQGMVKILCFYSEACQ